jgi:hypothetical protein
MTGLFNASSWTSDDMDSFLWTVHDAVAAHVPPVDLFPAYGSPYTPWMGTSAFQAKLASEAAAGQYPTRVDGRYVAQRVFHEPCWILLPNHVCPMTVIPAHQELRARFAPAITGTPTVLVNQTCGEMATAISAAQGRGDSVVSLQKFYGEGTGTWRYQAVIAPSPQ